jgi:hypothetical protein
MKKFLFLSALMMIINQAANAQATISSNTISTPTDFLGSYNAQPVLFKVFNNEAGYMDFLKNTGFGIGSINAIAGGASQMET